MKAGFVFDNTENKFEIHCHQRFVIKMYSNENCLPFKLQVLKQNMGLESFLKIKNNP